MQVLPETVLRRMSPEDRKKLGKAAMLSSEALAAAEAKAEKELQRLIAATLNRLGVMFNASRMDRRTTCRRGWPDFTFALRDKTGRAVPCAVEVKAWTGKLEPEQRQMLDALARNGWKTAVVRSYEEFMSFMREVCN